MNVSRSILERLGPKHATRREEVERKLLTKQRAHERGDFHLRRYISLNSLTRLGLRISGLRERGLKNIFDIRVVENEVVLPKLPGAFEGFRLLQLTDLHCDLHPGMMDQILATMHGIAHDAVVLTGDYHNEIMESPGNSLEAMRRFIPHLHPVRFATLGNHDYLSTVEVFEECGLPVLLNESRLLARDGQRLWICGVDDAHFFGTHDLVAARKGIPEGETTILLSHTPETYREAAALGYDLHLSGHTHGGQICLSGGLPILNNTRGCRREHLGGAWREGAMLGYTSRGTGSAGVAARFNCPPEITLHRLTRTPSGNKAAS